MIASICDTCRVCRQWKRPTDRAVNSTRVSFAFNNAMQCDLLFVMEHIILHMVDEATRFSMATLLNGKTASDILSGLALRPCSARRRETPGGTCREGR